MSAIEDGDPATEEDLVWLESYDGAKGIFTFHDTPGQKLIGPLNYLVAGWYTENTSDHLHANLATSQSTWFETLDKLGWTIDHKSILTQIAKNQSNENSQPLGMKGGEK